MRPALTLAFVSSAAALFASLFVAAVAVEARAQSASQPNGQAAQSQPGEPAELAEAGALSRQVVALYAGQKYAEALPLAERAYRLREKLLEGGDVRLAEAAGNLGRVHLALGNWDKAEDFLKRSAAAYEKGATSGGLSHARTLDTLATIRRFAKGDFAAASEYAERSLEMKERAADVPADELITNLYALAELYELRGRAKEAVALHRRAIALREQKGKRGELLTALERFNCLTERLKMWEESAQAEARLSELRAQMEREREARKAEADGTTVEGGVINGKALSKPVPPYPPAARDARAEGTVKVWITVNEQGRVVEAAACGHPLLTDVSVRAAYAARFEPTTVGGRPVKVRGTITYKFDLR